MEKKIIQPIPTEISHQLNKTNAIAPKRSVHKHLDVDTACFWRKDLRTGKWFRIYPAGLEDKVPPRTSSDK